MDLASLEAASGLRLKRFIAWGDGGAVYLGIDPNSSQKVILRLFDEELPKENASRIERELSLAIGINHSNVAKTFCYGWTDDQLFVAMEHVEGSLADLIGGGTVLTKRALLYLIQAARGLSEMAKVGLYHGALKPSNFLLTEGEILKVSDLALIHAAPEGCTLPEVGRYLAPEVDPNDDAKMKQDMYALGAVFYHLLLGKAPNMYKRKRLRTLRKDLPSKFCAKIERLLAQNPDDRYCNYGELLQHLDQLADEQGLVVPSALTVSKEAIALPENTTDNDQESHSTEVAIEPKTTEAYRDEEYPSRNSIDEVSGKTSVDASTPFATSIHQRHTPISNKKTKGSRNTLAFVGLLIFLALLLRTQHEPSTQNTNDGSSHGRAILTNEATEALSKNQQGPPPIIVGRETQINDGPNGCSNLRHVASGEHVYVLWTSAENRIDDIYLRHSKDEGDSWDAQRRVRAAPRGKGNASCPQIACEGSNVYIVWHDDRDPRRPSIYFNASTDASATWLPNDVILTPYRKVSAAKIACTESDVCVFWYEQGYIYSCRSTDHGLTWSSPQKINKTNCGGAFVVNSSDCFYYVAWTGQRDDNSVHDIYFNSSADGGLNWQPNDTCLDSAPPREHRSAYPILKCSGENVSVFWSILPKEHCVRTSSDGGITFSRRKTFDFSFEKALACSGPNVYCVWEHHTMSNAAEIHFQQSATAGKSWQRSKIIAQPFATKPILGYGAGRLWMVWLERYDIALNSTDGADWHQGYVTVSKMGKLDSWYRRLVFSTNRAHLIYTYGSPTKILYSWAEHQ